MENLKINAKMFNPILIRISKILKYNYLDDFYVQKNVELLQIPTNQNKANLPGLEFNSHG